MPEESDLELVYLQDPAVKQVGHSRCSGSVIDSVRRAGHLKVSF
jgi:hypothetical protein